MSAGLDDQMAWCIRNPDEGLDILDKIESEESLIGFIQVMWSILEPNRDFVDGWAVRAICEHLEAVSRGEIRRLLINVPPGFMKSLTVNTFWPAWEWGPKNRPDIRYISASYAEQLTVRDNRRMRNLLLSEQYRRLWGDRFFLTMDQNAKVRFDTSKTGFKIATSVGGVGTGERADRVLVDDAHNIKDGESEAKRNEVLQWFTEVVPTRLNDPMKSVIIVIMQRVHEQDVSGLILEKELGYEHLCYDKQTEVLTRNGWTAFPDLERGCEVMSVDPTTLEAEWQAPTGYVEKVYSGEMIHYKSLTADLMVTPEHRMVYCDANDRTVSQWRVRQAQHLPGVFYLPQVCTMEGTTRRPVVFGGYTWEPMVFAEFMGWYLAEGYTGESRQVRLCQKREPYVDEIRDVLEHCPFDYGEYITSVGVTHFYIKTGRKSGRRVPLGNAIREHGICSFDKRVPDQIKSMGAAEKKAFLCAYLKGDGWRTDKPNPNLCASSRSRRLVDDLQEIVVSLGWASQVRSWRGQYFLTIRSSKVPGRERKWYAKILPRHTARVPYSGKVYCVSVPSTAVLVRRNGKVSVSGNCIPMEYEHDHPYPSRTSLHFVDPRTKDGDLAWPERFPSEHIEIDLKPALRAWGGSYAEAGQLQQRPAPRGGGMFKKANWLFVDAPPTAVRSRVRGWDLASTKDAGAYTAGVKGSIAPPPGQTEGEAIYIEDVVRGQWGVHDVEKEMVAAAKRDGLQCVIDFPQDPGQSGKWQRTYLVSKFNGYNVRSTPETGSKEDRAKPLEAQQEGGNVYLVRGPWNDAFINEAAMFPNGRFKDQVDAVSRMYARLFVKKPRRLGRPPTVVKVGG